MGDCARFTVLVASSLLLMVPATGFAETPPVSELIQQVGTDLGFDQSYRKGGLAGVAPHTRGGDEAHPGKELGLAVEEMKMVEKGAPTFYRAFRNFPADPSALAESQFTWQIQSIQERPTLVFYTNRTFTDQVAGFGSGTKHKVGRKMMLGEVEKLFQSVRSSFEAASVEDQGARRARAD